jgi:hypothetical protein
MQQQPAAHPKRCVGLIQSRYCHMAQRAPTKASLVIGRKNFTLASALLFSLISGQGACQARQMDGFFMYCISNNDGTGFCTNEEDQRNFACLIVPGQIITCPMNTSQSVECVWISGVSANQAQFWCDPEDEAAMYGSIGQSLDQPVLEDSQINADELKSSPQQPSEPALEPNIFQGAF